MNKLSQLAETLIGSEIVRLGNAIAERIRQGEKIYNYTIGDFDPKIFPIPLELKQAIQESYDEGHTNYPPGDGVAILRSSVIDFIKEEQGISYEMDEVQIASGGRPLIYSLFRSIVDPGDKVIYPVPSWNNNHYVLLNGGRHCALQTRPEDDFMPRAEDIAPHLSDAVLLCLCTPQNPTGTTLDATGLAEICDLVLAENERRGPDQRKLYVMFDQMYGLLCHGNIRHENPVSLRPQMKDYTIFVDGVSKSFAATGLRVGWALGPAKVISKMKALLSHIGAWAPMAEQYATAGYLQRKDAVHNFLEDFRARLDERLRAFYDGFMELKAAGFPVDAIPPAAAIYLTVKLDLAGKSLNGKPLDTQDSITGFLLSEASLAIVPFYAFGAERESPWYRLSVGTASLEEIPEMFRDLKAALSRLEIPSAISLKSE
jgi:aspartate aminotransferase